MQKFGGSRVNVIVADETDDERCACEEESHYSEASQAQDSKGRRRPHSQPQDTQQGSKLSRGLI